MRIICLDWPLKRNAITVGKLNVLILGDFFYFISFLGLFAQPIHKEKPVNQVCGLRPGSSFLFYFSCHGQREDVRAATVAQCVSTRTRIFLLKIHVLQCNLTLCLVWLEMFNSC